MAECHAGYGVLRSLWDVLMVLDWEGGIPLRWWAEAHPTAFGAAGLIRRSAVLWWGAEVHPTLR